MVFIIIVFSVFDGIHGVQWLGKKGQDVFLKPFYKMTYSSSPNESKPAPSLALQANATLPAPASTLERDFIYVKGGSFQMGGAWGDSHGVEKQPLYEERVGNYYLGKKEVTVGQFRRFVEDRSYRTDAEEHDGCLTYDGMKWDKDRDANWKNPGFSQTDDHPVVCVSWNDAQAFAKWKSRQDNFVYRLPTGAEWEYAARSGGKAYQYAWGNGAPSGNIADESLKRKYPKVDKIWNGYDDGEVFTAPVGRYAANELGIFDMTGNVWEWCADSFRPRNNPHNKYQYRVLRGGGWPSTPAQLQTTFQGYERQIASYNHIGFRLAIWSR